MDEVIRVSNIEAYLPRRRAYLVTRRAAAETQTEKGKAIGMLQALADFEGMVRQLRVTPVASTIPPPVPEALHISCDDLAARWFSALHLPGACLDYFAANQEPWRLLARMRNHEKGGDIEECRLSAD